MLETKRGFPQDLLPKKFFPAIFFTTANLADLMTTQYALAKGFQEGNPLTLAVAALMADLTSYDINTSLWISKIAATAAVLAVGMAVQRGRVRFLPQVPLLSALEGKYQREPVGSRLLAQKFLRYCSCAFAAAAIHNFLIAY